MRGQRRTYDMTTDNNTQIDAPQGAVASVMASSLNLIPTDCHSESQPSGDQSLISTVSRTAESQPSETAAKKQKPWELLGISRPTWYRRGRPGEKEAGYPYNPKQHDTWIKKLSDKLKRPMYDLLVLAQQNDPFNAETTARKREAEWFAVQYRTFGFGIGTHTGVSTTVLSRKKRRSRCLMGKTTRTH
jgi:hypothetical protein